MASEPHNEGPPIAGHDDALECYRPGRDDANDPYLAPLVARLAADSRMAQRFDGLQRVDRSIQAAFDRVDVPPDLAVNILARLAQSELPAPATALTAAAASTAKPASSVPRIRRRALLIAATLAATSAAIVLGVLWAMQRPHVESQSSLLAGSIAVFLQESANRPQGELVGNAPPPADLPFSKDVLLLRGTRWRNVAGYLDGGAVAYDLPAIGGARATLYVSHGTVPNLTTFAPLQSTGTGGCSAGAWQVDGTLYVLVVDGDNRSYQNFLVSHGPIA